MTLPLRGETIYTVELPARGRHGYVNCGVIVLGGMVVEAAPIMRKFVGQPISNVERWAHAQGGTCTAHEPKLTQSMLPL